jgi:hypothetical protein
VIRGVANLLDVQSGCDLLTELIECVDACCLLGQSVFGAFAVGNIAQQQDATLTAAATAP